MCQRIFIAIPELLHGEFSCAKSVSSLCPEDIYTLLDSTYFCEIIHRAFICMLKKFTVVIIDFVERHENISVCCLLMTSN